VPGRKNVGLSRKVILALADGPKTFRELREIVKDVPKSTLSGVLCYLLKRGEVKRRKVRRRVGKMFKCPECGHVFYNSRRWMYVYEYYIPQKAPYPHGREGEAGR